jgi:hypothetical protein
MDLIKTYGESIIRAIVESSFDSRYLRDLDDIKLKHQQTHSQQQPFGPPGQERAFFVGLMGAGG